MSAERVAEEVEAFLSRCGPMTCGLPRSADILRVRRHVSKVPTGDMLKRQLSLTLSTRHCSDIETAATTCGDEEERLPAPFVGANGGGCPPTAILYKDSPFEFK